jgi:cytoskeletal protein CcmA (bactofilin family)
MQMKPRGRAESATSRGQSETLGFVLVFSLLIIGALVVVGLGATAIGDTEKQLSDDRAEKTLTQFDSKAGLVALEESDSQRVSLPNDENGQFFVDEDAGWMAIVIENRSTGNTQEIFNSSLGAMTYENGDTTFAYQGGGVWRETENGGQMISPPEFHYRNGTLTLPAISVTGEGSIDGTAVIKQNGTTKEFPTASPLASETNPLEKFEVRVVVSSDYYGGWGQYFEERTDGAVRYDETRERAILELVAPADYPPVGSGLYSGTTDALEINNANVYSYNSSTPGTTTTGNAKVAVVGDLEIDNNGDVYGDVEVGGDLKITHNQGTVHDGNISYGENSDIEGAPVCDDSSRSGHTNWDIGPDTTDCGGYWVEQNGSIEDRPVVNRLIVEQVNKLEEPENNDNDEEGNINESTNRLSCTSPCEIDAGSYYLEEISSSDPNLIFNTSGGDVNIAVDGDVHIDGTMDVDGSGRVNLYINETFEGANGFKAGNRSSSRNPASQFWVYLKTDGTATFNGGGSEFVGVFYGPGGVVDDGAEIEFTSMGGGQSEFYGGLLGDITTQINNADVYFDEALTKVDPVTVETTWVKITYLHITVNEIRIED